MPDLTFTLSAGDLTRLIDAIAASAGYDSSGGETKTNFVRRIQKERWKALVRRYESDLARNAVAVPGEIGVT